MEALGDEIVTLAAHLHAGTHRMLTLLARFDRLRGWEPGGHRSCTHWLAFRTGFDLGTAREHVRVAARIVRGLCDWRPPLGVRELARRTDTNAGYVTRVLSLLEEEDVIVRGGRGKVVEVRWRDLLRRWSRDYSVTETNRAVQYLVARGLSELRERLASFDDRYAVTGQFAVPPEAEVVPGRSLSCYVTSAELAARELDLRPTDSGANAVLLEPFDELVFERTRQSKGLTTVALTQCVVDLLTGSGREPAQADALMSWMERNENAWRT